MNLAVIPPAETLTTVVAITIAGAVIEETIRRATTPAAVATIAVVAVIQIAAVIEETIRRATTPAVVATIAVVAVIQIAGPLIRLGRGSEVLTATAAIIVETARPRVIPVP
jgi:hypothetical protein